MIAKQFNSNVFLLPVVSQNLLNLYPWVAQLPSSLLLAFNPRSLTRLLSHWVLDRLIYLCYLHLHIRWLTHPLVHSQLCLFTRLLIHSLIHSLIHLFIHQEMHHYLFSRTSCRACKGTNRSKQTKKFSNPCKNVRVVYFGSQHDSVHKLGSWQPICRRWQFPSARYDCYIRLKSSYNARLHLDLTFRR